MDTHNSALGAPQDRFARPPTGFRRWSPSLLRTERAADGFGGLPPGVKVAGQLLAALKDAAPQIGISPRLVHAVDWLFRFTQPQDWEPGARPVVWPSARMQQEALGLSPTQAKTINRRLIEIGLISMKDSPNGKRYGKRDPKGRIVEAYGFDLSPIAARYVEFRRLAEEGRAERLAMGRLRRRATISRKAIVQILETAAEYGLAGEEWTTLSRDCRAIGTALKAIERSDEMEAGVLALERRQQAARERLETMLRDVDSDPKGPENRPHYNNYKPTPDPLKDTVIAAEDCSRGEGAGSLYPEAAKPKERRDKGMVHGIAPEELVRLAPKLKPYLRRPNPNWPEVADAAEWLRHDLGVSKPLWGDACLAMGRDLAAIALAIVSTKDPEHFTSSAGGYFHGMVIKARAGELHLERTVWALRRASQPDRQPGKGRDHDRHTGGPAWR
jgi:replication initiation protein RepC